MERPRHGAAAEARPTVLMVSKPVAPPWNDSSKNLVRDLARSGQGYRYRVLTPRDQPLDHPGVDSEPLYDALLAAHTPPLRNNLRVLARLARRDDAALTHFFFAPNPRSALAARAVLALRPRRSIQTMCSAPASFAGARRLLFADRTVTVSRWALDRLVDAGVPRQRLACIPPGIALPPPVDSDARRRARRRHGLPLDATVVIYPGDYQFSQAASTVARAVTQLADLPRLRFVFACRIKQRASRARERAVRALLGAAGAADRVHLLNDVPDMPGLLAACNLCVLPAESLYAKMDLPLVLIEALSLGVPIVVTHRPPLSELLEHGDVGLGVPPVEPFALAAAIRSLVAGGDGLTRLGAAAVRVARARFDIGAVSARYEQLYDDLIRG